MDIDQKAIEQKVSELATVQIVESVLGDGMNVSDFERRLQSRIEETVIKRCDEIVQPFLHEEVSSFVIRRTNEYGEPKGDVTFTEYVVGLAEDYLNQTVDYQGNEVNPNSYGGRETQTRLTHLLKDHLHHHIATQMKDAVKIVIENIAPAIATTCELKVREATEQIRRAMGK